MKDAAKDIELGETDSTIKVSSRASLPILGSLGVYYVWGYGIRRHGVVMQSIPQTFENR